MRASHITFITLGGEKYLHNHNISVAIEGIITYN